MPESFEMLSKKSLSLQTALVLQIYFPTSLPERHAYLQTQTELIEQQQRLLQTFTMGPVQWAYQLSKHYLYSTMSLRP